MNKILVPYDFSETAHHALDFAMQMAYKAGACDVTLFHVIQAPSASAFQKVMGGGQPDLAEVLQMKDMIAKIKDMMDQLIADHATANVTVNRKVRIGNPDIEIIEEVEKEGTEMVVMGTTGADGLDEFFVGSNAEKVVRHASCPVITMRNEAKLETIKEIVFASDFENLDEARKYFSFGLIIV